ncbi:MAG: RDD family protein [Candidatus Izimaplasma sp.]|nr:RDD family protein [Candidatus Izimaplasma bacterium]
MSVGLFRRIGSFVLDALPIFLLVSIAFSTFVGDLLKADGYDELMAEYQTYNEQYYTAIEPYQEQLDNNEITENEYLALVEDDYNTFVNNTTEHREAITMYFIKSTAYHFFAFTLIYYIYNVILHGRTYGRRLLNIELGGRINWWTLLIREVFYKMFFWLITLFILGIGIDVAAILFSRRKRTLRDIVSNTYVKFEGVDYPF